MSDLPWAHPPSPQPAEQSHATLKRALIGLQKSTDLVEVLKAWRAAIMVWCGPCHDEERGFTLTCARPDIDVRPGAPDAWMLANATHLIYIPAIRETVRVAPIGDFVRAARENPATWHKLPRSASGVMVHALGLQRPGPIPDLWLQNAARQVRASSKDVLCAAWDDLGIRSPRTADEPEAQPYRLHWPELEAFWTQAALVTERADGYTRCTCAMSCAFGHCVHEYAIKELRGHQKLLGAVVPRAAVGAAARRRKRRRVASSGS